MYTGIFFFPKIQQVWNYHEWDLMQKQLPWRGDQANKRTPESTETGRVINVKLQMAQPVTQELRLKVTRRKVSGYPRNALWKEKGSYECQVQKFLKLEQENTSYLNLFCFSLNPLFLDVTLETSQQLVSSREDRVLGKEADNAPLLLQASWPDIKTR